MRTFVLIFLLAISGKAASAADRACEPINIFAAASTTDVIEEIAEAYERESACSVTTVFAASGTLARQIASGAPADIFLSANADWTEWLQQSGIIRERNQINLLGNDLVLVVPKSTRLQDQDLSDPQTLVAFLGNNYLAIGDPASVPAGRYAAAALRDMGIADTVKDNIVSASSVRTALAWVARGEASAGIVYRTDAAIESDVIIAATLPQALDTPIVYTLALIGRVPNQAALDFYNHLQSFEAASRFADHGFRRVSAK